MVREKLQPWFEKFGKLHQEPMDRDLSKAFMILSCAESSALPLPQELLGTFLYKMGSKRAEHLNLKLTPYALGLLCCVVNSPGGLVMYLSYLTHACPKVTVTIEVLSRKFSMGFPGDPALSQMWDEQKGSAFGIECDNALDHLEPLP